MDTFGKLGGTDVLVECFKEHKDLYCEITACLANVLNFHCNNNNSFS